ncbi:PREDICTED: probable disease resistance protein RPP1 isoform X2 [Camelina sativa]|uniref:ADP-ribosyl cyclase/cyclic ADP-ribose hydrolase n=1 Tax=Camelina sativa TaxID=90675 RepID=A0ABM1QSG8_CAMSA|nr:PREDICTED: probable disease resistance protein RPP1 isoform X2 [Camelina sativa]
MNSSFSFSTFFRKLRFQHNHREIDSPSSVPPSSLSRTWKHHVFLSFHGEDVRKTFLTHILKEFRGKGIDPFIDNDIERGKTIGPELIEAIKGSRIAIVLLSRNYASSSWCLNELVEIMKCREELSQIVMTIFYDVDPTDVKKQMGAFGKVFNKTCKGKPRKEIKRWRIALEGVATIAGEHSRNWVSEAAMIEKIAMDVSNKLNNSTPSRDFNSLVGMGAHMKNMGTMLGLESDEVRMIGIWGPSGIGKTTIARYLYNQISSSFDLSVFMEDIKELTSTRRVSSDDYSAKLYLQKQFLSQILNHKDIEIPHLGVVQDRLNDKKVLIVLDNIDQSIQLDAIAKETSWFGHGSRIIITTQDQKLLKSHGINHIYKVDFPSVYEASHIFCMYAFGQKFPKKGLEALSWEVTNLLGKLPLGLRVMGSHFRGMSKQEWIDALPRLRTRLDASIQSILMFSYNALCDEDKDLFVHIACLFNYQMIELMEDHLGKSFLDVKQQFRILSEKSLISVENGCVYMHNLLVQLGKEIVCRELGNQSIIKPGKRQFLVDARDICEVLTNDTGSKNVIGIHFDSSGLSGELSISERAFEGMSNLEFLRFKCMYDNQNHNLSLPLGLNHLSQKLRLLHWDRFPMTCLPSNFCTECLVELYMIDSQLQKLWEGDRPLRNLKWVNLSLSKNLKELPDLSTATNLQHMFLSSCSSLVELPSLNATNLKKMDISKCSSLVELPSWMGNANNLSLLNLMGCSSLVELPSSIGNATNLQTLKLDMCTSLVELPSSIGNLHKLQKLIAIGCSKLEVLPTNINLESLDEVNFCNCLMLKSFPEISTHIRLLNLARTAIKEVPSSIKSWPNLSSLGMSFNENLQEFPHALDIITSLVFEDKEMQEISPWVKKVSRLRFLTLIGCKKLVSIPQLPDSLDHLRAENCESLVRLDCFFHNPKHLQFTNCFKLNKEARELIVQTSTRCTVLPGEEVPENFTYRANTGSSVMVNLNKRPLSKTSRFKACILLVGEGGDKEKEVFGMKEMRISYLIMEKHNPGVSVPCKPIGYSLSYSFTDHLYIFEFEGDVTSNELRFDFKIYCSERKIKECGVMLSKSLSCLWD